MYGQSPSPYGSSPGSGYDQSYERMVARLRRPAYGPWFLVVLLLGGAGYGAYWGWNERQRLLGEVDKGQAALKAQPALEARVKALEGEKTDLAKNVAAKDSELAELKGAHDKLEEKMKEEIAKGEIELISADGKLRVDLVDKILFDSGDAQISKRGESVLLRVGTVLALPQMGDKQIQVSGHTDNQPILSPKLKAQYPSNWELSVTRALNVVRFLQDAAKVPPDRLGATGYGEHHPIASNRTVKGRARNRRIEILLTPSFDPRRVSQEKLKAQKAAEAEAPAATAEPKGDEKAAKEADVKGAKGEKAQPEKTEAEKPAKGGKADKKTRAPAPQTPSRTRRA
jgi:chemotaxis protein MotB